MNFELDCAWMEPMFDMNSSESMNICCLLEKCLELLADIASKQIDCCMKSQKQNVFILKN